MRNSKGFDTVGMSVRKPNPKPNLFIFSKVTVQYMVDDTCDDDDDACVGTVVMSANLLWLPGLRLM